MGKIFDFADDIVIEVESVDVCIGLQVINILEAIVLELERVI